MKPLVTVITVCFNSEKTIERTIRSVLHQTYDNLEYIIIDGLSVDNTMNIIQKYADEFGNRLKVISEKDQGIYDAMNKGIKMASGELIGILNSDDYYEFDAVEKIVSHYNGYKYSVLYGLMRKVKDGKEDSIGLNHFGELSKKMIPHPTCFVSKTIYDEFGCFDLKYKVCADYEFMLRLKEKEQVVFNEIVEVITNFSIGGASYSYDCLKETLKIRYRYGAIQRKEFYIKYVIAIILQIFRINIEFML